MPKIGTSWPWPSPTTWLTAPKLSYCGLFRTLELRFASEIAPKVWLQGVPWLPFSRCGLFQSIAISIKVFEFLFFFTSLQWTISLGRLTPPTIQISGSLETHLSHLSGHFCTRTKYNQNYKYPFETSDFYDLIDANPFTVQWTKRVKLMPKPILQVTN